MNLSEAYRSRVKSVRINVNFSIDGGGFNSDETVRFYITRTIKTKRPDARIYYLETEVDEVTGYLLLNTTIRFECLLSIYEVACFSHNLITSGDLEPDNYMVLTINPDTKEERCFALEGNELPDIFNEMVTPFNTRRDI